MRQRIIILCVLIVLLIPGCILLNSPDKGTPGITPVASGTQSTPAATLPIELTATLPSPTETFTPTPANTLIPAPTQIPASSTPTETPFPTVSFYMQPGTPIHVTNFLDPQSGCNWMGIAGQVFNLSGEPLIGLVVEVGGILEGQIIQQIAITGGSPSVGPGGYAITLADHPVASDGTIWFQLLDQDGNPKTGRILLTTNAECDKNLTLINLIESSPLATRVRLPIILNSTP